MNTETVLLGSLTIPGHPKHLHAARAFVTQTLDPGCQSTDIAVLLASELISNAMKHSDSRREGGTIILNLIAVAGAIRTEVIDLGGPTVPIARPIPKAEPGLAESGRGLVLVEALSDRWGFNHDDGCTTTWFELAMPDPA